MGTGPGGAHATLSSVVVSLMLAYPHSSALDPCSSRFLFDCDLLPSHCGPQLSTLLVPPSLSLSVGVCPSRHVLTYSELAASLPTAAHARLLQYIHASIYMLHASEYPRACRCFGLSDGR